eukprot:TRINITY_DN4539_c0_g1_i2.p1 TRINITY_DN4539_c0_g1~~TRINITY_DN4539_c0_g1_i2.p1  ORF type:complete len:287 (-),score=54.85 TRINITY_DN4539_c0_g1_i2:749-1609(-)
MIWYGSSFCVAVPMLSLLSKVPLSSGATIPLLGLGVYQTARSEAASIVLAAFKAGYRHVDTAALYKNEGEVGEAIRKSGIPRSEIFITTKLWNNDQGYSEAKQAFAASLQKLGLDYVDLYLLHSPVRGKRLDSWRALEELHAEGKIRSIGVSNYGIHHLKELFENCKVRPVVNQIEVSPYNTREELCKFCVDNNIVVEAYSPLTRGRKLNDQKLVAIASKYKKSTAQLLIRWSLQRGYVCLPKSSHEKRLVENADVFDFEISDADMKTLNGFDEGLVCGWDPTTTP